MALKKNIIKYRMSMKKESNKNDIQNQSTFEAVK